MKILFCCEFYFPSIGGVQEVMRQLAERLVEKGHHVTVATSALPNRNFETLNGVEIKEFSVSGNIVRGIFGEQDIYQNYVVKSNFDILMIKAAQQWTFDALWPVLDNIKIPKVFIPCGFSGLMEPAYANYFLNIPDVLRKFDHLIFYASNYRDINFTREHDISNFSIIPNGASEKEFNAVADGSFRSRHDIAEDAFVFITVGSLTGLKGHLELAQAFSKLPIATNKKAVLILNGNDCQRLDDGMLTLFKKFFKLIETYGLYYTSRHVLKSILRRMGIVVGKLDNIYTIAQKLNKVNNNKKILITNFPRADLIQAYMASDLFAFASNIEYSPLVLFESAAAGVPFMSVNVGNASEIAQWTQSGEICTSYVDNRGYTRASIDVLSDKMAQMMNNPSLLKNLGENGKRNWLEKFTWQKIASQYEKVFEVMTEK